jgi:Tol biopolymer transport system component
VYDIGTHEGAPFIVSELLEGDTLRQRLQDGAIAVRKAIEWSVQIAHGLAAAHGKGIVHRDLKPENVFVTAGGHVKILDFGLAKLTQNDPAFAGVSAMQTSPPLTMHGVVLGTIGYMAPEQVRGLPADHRADIFAFGTILYEMLSGQRAFRGETTMDTMTSILKEDPPELPVAERQIPPALARIVGRAIEKNPAARFQTVSDLAFALESLSSSSGAAAIPASLRVLRSHERLVWAVACLIGATAAGLAGWFLKAAPQRPSADVVRFSIGIAPGDQLLGANPTERSYPFGYRRPSRTAIAWSPDGKLLVFSAVRGDKEQLYVRALSRLDATPIAGTEESENPFFSPDGQWIGFWSAGELKKVPVGGGPPVTICKMPVFYGAALFGASWGENDLVVFAGANSGLWQVSANGGTPKPLTTLDAQKGELSHRLPQILPGGKAVLFTIEKAVFRWDDAQIVVRSLETGEQTTLIEGGADARWVSTGHIVYARQGTLMAAPFDLAHLKLAGGPVGIVQGVMQSVNTTQRAVDTAAQFTVSGTGALAYVQGGITPDEHRSLVWVDRTGAVRPLPMPALPYLMPRLSPDGRQVVVYTQQTETVWIYDLARATLTRLTTEGQNDTPVWSPDGKRVAFDSATGGAQNLFWKQADGTGSAERLATSDYLQRPSSWSSDGQTLAFVQNEPMTLNDIWTISLADRNRTPRPFLRTAADEAYPDFSPDGHWIAYTSDESGRPEVYVQAFPGPGERHQISVEGGHEPA